MTALRTGRPAPWSLRTTARLRVGALLLTVHSALVAGAVGQEAAPQPRGAPAAVRYGKWAALGLAAGFTILGAATHDHADRDYAALLDFCRDHGPCPIGSDGRYANPGAEALYGRVRNGDRMARAWLVGGQVALVGSAVLFVMELKSSKRPENIPYSPYVAAGRYGTLVGLRLPWRRRGRRQVMGDE
jgi:hypothetical protein